MKILVYSVAKTTIYSLLSTIVVIAVYGLMSKMLLKIQKKYDVDNKILIDYNDLIHHVIRFLYH